MLPLKINQLKLPTLRDYIHLNKCLYPQKEREIKCFKYLAKDKTLTQNFFTIEFGLSVRF